MKVPAGVATTRKRRKVLYPWWPSEDERTDRSICDSFDSQIGQCAVEHDCGAVFEGIETRNRRVGVGIDQPKARYRSKRIIVFLSRALGKQSTQNKE